MDVRVAAEVPDEGRPFEPPVVPFAVVAQIVLLIESQVARFQTALTPQAVADLLLVFRVGSDTYSQYRTFAKDKTKAYSTCELVLLDVRTGLVPFTRVTSRDTP